MRFLFSSFQPISLINLLTMKQLNGLYSQRKVAESSRGPLKLKWNRNINLQTHATDVCFFFSFSKASWYFVSEDDSNRRVNSIGLLINSDHKKYAHYWIKGLMFGCALYLGKRRILLLNSAVTSSFSIFKGQIICLHFLNWVFARFTSITKVCRRQFTKIANFPNESCTLISNICCHSA